MTSKLNPSKHNIALLSDSLPSKGIEINGLVTQRGFISNKQRLALTRENHSKPKDKPRVDSPSKASRSVRTSAATDKQILSFNQSLSSEDGKARPQCPNHPNKRVKYFLASNTSMGFCTKCAITMSDREDLIDQQSNRQQQVELLKVDALDRFKQSLISLKQSINQKLLNLSSAEQNIQQLYRRQVDELGEQFKKMFDMLAAKYDRLVDRLGQQFEQAKQQISQSQQILATSSAALDNYNKDITKNYADIIEALSMDSFEDIMQKYSQNLSDHIRAVKSCEVRNIEFDHHLELVNLHSFVGRVAVQEPCQPNKSKRQSLRARLDNKENNPNLANCDERPKQRPVR